MDFRTVDVPALKWFPQSRKTVPVTPIRVQVPPSQCAIELLPGRYAVDLTLAGHPVHEAFVQFVKDVEAHAQTHARPTRPDLRWCSCVDADALLPRFRVSAFDDAKFFTGDGDTHLAPTDIQSCAVLLELGGAWTTDACWGVRWKVLEVKQAPPVPPPFLFLPEPAPDRAPPPVPFAFLDDPESHDKEGQVVGPPRDDGRGQLAQRIELLALEPAEPGHP